MCTPSNLSRQGRSRAHTYSLGRGCVAVYAAHRTFPGGAKMTPVTGSFCALEMVAVAWPKDTGGLQRGGQLTAD